MKNNIKVEINTTTINNFKPIASLNDTKLKQNIKIKNKKKKKKKKKNHLNHLQKNKMKTEPNEKLG